MHTSASLAAACALCGRRLADAVQQNTAGEAEGFCCRGCQVVHAILQAQGALPQFRDHPLYRQALQSGLIAHPPEEQERTPPSAPLAAESHTWHVAIQGMWCPSCAQLIDLMLSRQKGIVRCAVDYATDLAAITYLPGSISKERITLLIGKWGYHLQPLQDPRELPLQRHVLLRFIVAAFFALNIMMLAYPLYAAYFEGGDADGYAALFAWLSLYGALPVLLYSGWPIWRRCLMGLRLGLWGMEALVTMGVGAATALSLYELFSGGTAVYFDSATVVVMLVLLGKIMESKAKFSAKDALVQLSLALPRKGRKRLASGAEAFVPIKEIHPGDCLVVRMGEKIVLDGVVEEGAGLCDESLMTGEPRLCSKERGSGVLAGTVLRQGYLAVRVTAALEESTLQRILDTVGGEIGHKSRYVRAADRVMRGFVPAVLGLALGTFFFCLAYGVQDGDQTTLQTAVIRAVAVLLISCPCAIGIAAPLAEARLLNVLAKAGIIVRNRGCLSFLGGETIFLFDKTGTLTEGVFTVQEGLKQLEETQRAALKGLTAYSLHPVAAAIHAALPAAASPLMQIEELVGKGLRGYKEDQCYRLGSAAFMRAEGIELPAVAADDRTLDTTVYFAGGGQVVALRLGDRLRAGAAPLIQALQPITTALVSGDAPAPVKRVADLCGLSRWYAEHSPLQKKALVDELKKKGEIVAMLGDGVNDAPALTAAHIGIAVVSATDISIQVSDLLLTTHNFRALEVLRRTALKGRKIIRQNLFWAFFYNLIGLGLAAGGLLTPFFAAFAMTASSLIVVLNTRRLA